MKNFKIMEIIYFIINEHIYIKRRFNKKKFKYNNRKFYVKPNA